MQSKLKLSFSDGCLSHKTAVAVLAIAAEIRFIIEKLFEANI